MCSEVLRQMDGSVGWDAVIICTSNLGQERYWQARLESTSGQVCTKGALVLAVHEDWGGDGAGNGLGTLYAYRKAQAKAKAAGVDLDAKLRAGWAVGLFHTAGKGTRLAPLPGSENNNKPGVKLPSTLIVGGETVQLTILEAVVRQTNAYAPGRQGRLSVFWGDQIFLPSAGTPPSGAHHADILAFLGTMPSAEEWAERGLEKYGLIAVGEDGEATQVEKVSHATALSLLSGFGAVKAVGPSLGSFSISAALLFAFLKEFTSELERKQAKLDSDPHFWMPLTLSLEAYQQVMASKKVAPAAAQDHYTRMAAFKAAFMEEHPGAGLFGCIDAGQGSYWWDYGQLQLYFKNCMLVRAEGEEADALRAFFRISDRTAGSALSGAVDAQSVVLSSAIKGGSVRGSVCVNVTVADLDVEDCLLINVTARRLRARGCVLYNVVDESEGGLCVTEGVVRADVVTSQENKFTLASTLDTDGGQAWKERLPGNTMSFEEVYTLNAGVDVLAAAAHARALAKRAAQAQA